MDRPSPERRTAATVAPRADRRHGEDMTLMETPAIRAALADLPGVHLPGYGKLLVHVKAASFPDAVTLVTGVAAVAEEMNHHPDVDLRYQDVTFTLSTHSAGGVTELDLELGRRIVTLATEQGAELLPPQPYVEVGIDALDRDAVLPFWRAALGYVERATDTATELHDPNGTGPVVWFQTMESPRTGRNRVHLDVYLPGEETCRERVAAAIAAGGRLVTDEFAPDWWVLADPEGNEICICTD
jgi:4a-hydroxytetrahydrobiopterin dehydratase